VVVKRLWNTFVVHFYPSVIYPLVDWLGQFMGTVWGSAPSCHKAPAVFAVPGLTGPRSRASGSSPKAGGAAHLGEQALHLGEQAMHLGEVVAHAAKLLELVGLLGVPPLLLPRLQLLVQGGGGVGGVGEENRCAGRDPVELEAALVVARDRAGLLPGGPASRPGTGSMSRAWLLIAAPAPGAGTSGRGWGCAG
jgi:hypothetical protein